MFILDSLMIAGLRWTLETALTAAEAEMNDDSVLREQLLEAEMRREMGEISDEDFRILEGDLLARIREIKERREGAGPLAFAGQPMETTGDATFQVEASVSGDFHDPVTAPHTTVVHSGPSGGEEVAVIDIEPGSAAPPVVPVAEPAERRRDPRRRAGKPVMAAGASAASSRKRARTAAPAARTTGAARKACRRPAAAQPSKRTRATRSRK